MKKREKELFGGGAEGDSGGTLRGGHSYHVLTEVGTLEWEEHLGGLPSICGKSGTKKMRRKGNKYKPADYGGLSNTYPSTRVSGRKEGGG